ncbi:MAG: hypothetical protein ACXVXC_05950 [Nocardioidaceae bacterium]
MFESSHPFAPFDYLRVPYDVVGTAAPRGTPSYVGVLRASPRENPAGGRLVWVRDVRRGPRRESRRHRRRAGLYRLAGCPLPCHLSLDDPWTLLGGPPDGWHPVTPVLDAERRPVAQVWRHDDGTTFLPFDPGEVMHCCWSEGYRTLGAAARARTTLRSAMVHGYYGVRPLLPRPVQLTLRRALARRQELPDFPAWPVEHGLHDLYAWLLGEVGTVAGAPVPWIAPWPDGKTWAFVLTHDVETRQGRDERELLRADERSRGYRSSWNFVPERYDVDAATRAAVEADGCEVGVHGLRHDGKDLASARALARRLPAIRDYADRWGATGFRSPATQRGWRLMPRLGFDYDSSYTDTDPYEPQPGGCCSVYPFFIDPSRRTRSSPSSAQRRMVELPITLPQDHTLFEILREPDGRIWLDKAHQLRSQGAMVLVLTHPDYARDPHEAAAWRDLLEAFHGDETMWHALPRDVAAWWRQRAASVPRRVDGRWEVHGPAAGRARVTLTDAAAPLTGSAR